MSLPFNMPSRFALISFQEASIFKFHGCSHHLQWLWSPRKWSLSLFPLFPHLFAMRWRDWMPWSSFFECWALSQLFHSLLSLSSRLFSSSSLFAIRVVSSAYLRLLLFYPVILIPACASSSLAFHVMYSACKLNKQVIIYSLVLFSQFRNSPLFPVQF